MNEFLDMGGYARYVWSAYGISVVVLITTVILTRRNLAMTRKRLARRLRSAQEHAA